MMKQKTLQDLKDKINVLKHLIKRNNEKER